MSHKLLTDSRLFSFIERIDQDAIASAAASPCPHCGGPLDRADYPRKPRGLPSGGGVLYGRRPSLCCRKDGCRRRRTPPMVGLLGRRIYVAAVVVLVAACCQGPTPPRLQVLEEAIGVSPRTVRRWITWWREVFPVTATWQRLKGMLVPPTPAEDSLPAALLKRLAPYDLDGTGGVPLLLRHLAM